MAKDSRKSWSAQSSTVRTLKLEQIRQKNTEGALKESLMGQNFLISP